MMIEQVTQTLVLRFPPGVTETQQNDPRRLLLEAKDEFAEIFILRQQQTVLAFCQRQDFVVREAG